MAKIESLTEEQKARFPEFVKKWTDIGLCTEKANRKEAEDGIIEAYKIAGLKRPKIVWCDSPLSQGLTRIIVQKLESEGKLTKGLVGKNEKASVRASVRDSVRDSVRASVGASVRDSVGDSVWDSVGASVWDSVRDSVRDSVGASVGASVWDSVGASVGASVRDSVGASVWDSVRASVRDSVGASVWASVRDSVRDSVGASVRASVWDSGYGQHDANWLAFYDFFMEVNHLEVETEKLKGLWKIAKNAGWFLPHENICWVSERHNILQRNANGRLHSTTGMALQYPDGWGIYALNGVRFDEALFKKITSGKMPFQDILAIKDIDQRTQAMRFGDVWEFLKHTKAIELDKIAKERRDGTQVRYWLYKIPAGDIFTKDAYYAIYDDLVPESTKQYMSGVPECKTIAEAMAWKASDDETTITPEQWLKLIPGEDMN